MRQRRDRAVELEQLEKQLLQLTTDIKDKIKAMTEDVERKVGIENELDHDARKPVFCGLQTTKAQTSLPIFQSDQRLCYSCFGKYHI